MNEGVNAHMTGMKSARALIMAIATAGLLAVVSSPPALAAEPGFGHLYLNGQVVGTVVPPARVDAGSGQDPFYKVVNGVGGQLGVAGVGPGQPGYHGGDWQVFTVAFNVPPYLLTSGSAVLEAAAIGDVTITRQAAQDFRCPITSNSVG